MAEAFELSLAGAGFAFHDSEEAALSGIDLRVRAGEAVAVLGPQGSGTSTLCRLAAGLLDERGVGSGAVDAPASVAMLGEDPEAQLTGMTSFVDDEVRLPTRLSGSTRPVDVGAALHAFGMRRLLGRRLDTLSGGERQLVALTSLMTLRPALLVLDQPGLSLDPGARGLLAVALRRFCARGGAVLLAGHQHDELTAGADRVAFLRGGRLTAGPRPGALSDAVLGEHGVWSAVGGDPHREAPVRETSGRAGDARLDVRALTVSRGRSTIFADVDCRATRGEVVAVVGPNGAGKSTLLRAVAGLLDAEADVRVNGAVLVDGEHLTGMPVHRRAHRVAWVGQDPGAQLSASTVRAELDRALPLPPHRRRERAGLRAARAAEVERVLARTGLAEHANEHPYDLDPAQQKDLVIASALLLGAGVLLFDEPTLGRDLAGMRRLERVIAEVSAADVSVVLSTHDLRWAGRIAHRTLRLG
ncbi:ATP-binding cassette domain-containing protein [Leucobacter chromiiresistens]|uniref:Energy-coupling factor transport system ATP-binding protein n=1 Tax=Leucobacter chromiiresistens TaxID=1079994 RepID=A0A1H0XUE6_9MICO|nr:ABC transporter ATP-binding protein [Leucobacter chromiiresistens]SDQ06469.1 energy-coupling factor transport system ATP-binding protein [Leucobacter chromiiresistens]